MTKLIESQLADALAYIKVLSGLGATLPDDPTWGGGLRLWLPDVIPLSPDYKGEAPVAWLVANDSDGYDLTTTAPEPSDTRSEETPE